MTAHSTARYIWDYIKHQGRRAWLLTPVFLPGESYGQRSLTGYSPWGHKELDTTEVMDHNSCPSEDLSLGDALVLES